MIHVTRCEDLTQRRKDAKAQRIGTDLCVFALIRLPTLGLAAETRSDGRCIDYPIWLGEVRQATDAHPAMPAQKTPDPTISTSVGQVTCRWYYVRDSKLCARPQFKQVSGDGTCYW